MFDILVIGTVSGDYGGTSVSLFHLLNYLKNGKVKFYHLETGGIRNRNIVASLVMFTKLIFNLVRYSKKSKLISVHLNHSAIPILGPFIYLVAKILKKRYSIRIFGGYGYQDKSRMKNKISHFIVKNSFMYFAQTKTLFKEAKSDNMNVEWFPTVRPNSKHKVNSKICKKLVYVGRIIKEKGIFVILEASNKIDKNVSIDIYGPIQEGLSKEIFNDFDNVKYRGVIDPNNIYENLLNYDLMLFPTFYPGEGYPGIILEALNIGMPIISSDWLEIKDIINSDCAILIEPNNIDELSRNIDNIYNNKELYLKLCKGAQRQSRIFDLKIQYNNFLKIHEISNN